MIRLPLTIEGCYQEIKKLRATVQRNREQMVADSEAMHKLHEKAQEAFTGRDAYVMERCKTCRERMRGL
jgi:hypothetical protein